MLQTYKELYGAEYQEVKCGYNDWLVALVKPFVDGYYFTLFFDAETGNIMKGKSYHKKHKVYKDKKGKYFKLHGEKYYF